MYQRRWRTAWHLVDAVPAVVLPSICEVMSRFSWEYRRLRHPLARFR